MTRQFLTIPTDSTTSERVFSFAGLLEGTLETSLFIIDPNLLLHHFL
jgi:hypothetical protein